MSGNDRDKERPAKPGAKRGLFPPKSNSDSSQAHLPKPARLPPKPQNSAGPDRKDDKAPVEPYLGTAFLHPPRARGNSSSGSGTRSGSEPRLRANSTYSAKANINKQLAPAQSSRENSHKRPANSPLQGSFPRAQSKRRITDTPGGKPGRIVSLGYDGPTGSSGQSQDTPYAMSRAQESSNESKELLVRQAAEEKRHTSGSGTYNRSRATASTSTRPNDKDEDSHALALKLARNEKRQADDSANQSRSRGTAAAPTSNGNTDEEFARALQDEEDQQASYSSHHTRSRATGSTSTGSGTEGKQPASKLLTSDKSFASTVTNRDSAIQNIMNDTAWTEPLNARLAHSNAVKDGLAMLKAFLSEPTPTSSQLCRFLGPQTMIRELSFKDRFEENGSFKPRSASQVASCMLFMVGQEPKVPCDKCQRGGSLFTKCIIFPADAPKKLPKHNHACANCTYSSSPILCEANTNFQAPQMDKYQVPFHKAIEHKIKSYRAMDPHERYKKKAELDTTRANINQWNVAIAEQENKEARQAQEAQEAQEAMEAKERKDREEREASESESESEGLYVD